jgi:hypothetical protein
MDTPGSKIGPWLEKSISSLGGDLEFILVNYILPNLHI